MSYLPNRLEITNSGIVFADNRPCVITCTGGSQAIFANNATTVTAVGPEVYLVLSAIGATVVDFSGLAICSGLDLTVGNPTFMPPADNPGPFIFNSTTCATLSIPSSCRSVSIVAPLLTTITSIGTLYAGITNFTLNSDGAVDSTGIELILAACAAAGSAVTVDISGGTNAVPAGFGGATAATGEIVSVYNDTNDLPTSAWVKPAWKGTERYFWFNVNSSGSDPGAGGTGIEMMCGIGEDPAAVLALAMADNNGYSASVTGGIVSYTLDAVGLRTSAAGDDGTGAFNLQNEVDGSSGNASIDTIYANGGSVSYNS